MTPTLLKKLGAVLLLVGLLLPYGWGVRPVTTLWPGVGADEFRTLVMSGVPVLAALLYVAHALLRPVTLSLERHGPALHGALRAVYFILAGVYVGTALVEGASVDARLAALAAAGFTGLLLYWQQQRGSKAQRLPLLLLTVSGLALVYGWVLAGVRGSFDYGAYVVTAGFVLAAASEVTALRALPKITHGG